MLKIKDNVDLKELEKFGFEFVPKIFENKYHTTRYIFFFKNSGAMSIAKDNRLWLDFNKFDEKLFQNWNSKLYELIQAGLVEKVADNETK